MAKTLMVLGAVLFGAGLIWHFWGDKIALGKLPGDIRLEGAYGQVYFPFTTCLIVSIILSLVGMLFRR